MNPEDLLNAAKTQAYREMAMNAAAQAANQTATPPLLMGQGTIGQANTLAGTLTSTNGMYQSNKVWQAIDANANSVYRRYEPRFKIREIRNGYILCHAKHDGEVHQEDFCANLKEVGERVTAVLVQYQLEEEK